MFDFTQLPYAFGCPETEGLFKSSPEDFRVDEVLGFELTGEGEHFFLHIEKRGLNTEDLVKALAKELGKSEKTISYAGLKDKQALTTQWLSVHCPGKEDLNLSSLQTEHWRVLEAKRHLKKLKTGALAANDFRLLIRNLNEQTYIEERLAQIKTFGVPNYFGPQRFGYQGQNLVNAQKVLLNRQRQKNRFLRGIYYSAARAFLFNEILALRVKKGLWNKAVTGDLMQLAGSNSCFVMDDLDELISKRVAEFDISPAGVLWGRGAERLTKDALILQEEALTAHQNWCEALEREGLERAYRALVLVPQELHWSWEGNSLTLNFRLRPGSYATSLLREITRV